MNYAVGHAFNMHEMFMNFDKSKLKMTSELCQLVNGDPHKDKLIEKIFRECLKEVLNDIIDNNVTFLLPTGARLADIHVQRTTGDDFAMARRNGKWQDVDFLNSYFSGYLLTLNMYNKEGKPVRIKPIYLDNKLKNKLTEYTNQGKQYC